MRRPRYRRSHRRHLPRGSERVVEICHALAPRLPPIDERYRERSRPRAREEKRGRACHRSLANVLPVALLARERRTMTRQCLVEIECPTRDEPPRSAMHRWSFSILRKEPPSRATRKRTYRQTRRLPRRDTEFFPYHHQLSFHAGVYATVGHAHDHEHRRANGNAS